MCREQACPLPGITLQSIQTKRVSLFKVGSETVRL